MTSNPIKKPKCLLVLTSTFPRWQGDKEPPFVLELSTRLANHFDVVVLAPHAHGARLEEHLSNLEVLRYRYFFSRWESLAYNGGILANLKKNPINYFLVPFLFLSQFLALLRLLRHKEFDVIHAHWLIPQGLVAVCARMMSRQKPAIICISHGGDLFGLSNGLFTWIKCQVIKRVDKLTVVSEAMHQHAYSLSGKKNIDVIPMGVDLLKQFIPLASKHRDPHEILFAGRLVEKKGVRYLINAMPEILKHHPQTKLLIAGDGPERTVLENLASKAGVEPHVKFMGAMNKAELENLYRRASVFVGPSIVAKGGDQEGLGLVFVEALGCECAVVASDLPAIQDVVIDKVTGLICEQKNSRDIARKVICLLEDPGLRERLACTGRQHVLTRFDWEIVAQRYIEQIENHA